MIVSLLLFLYGWVGKNYASKGLDIQILFESRDGTPTYHHQGRNDGVDSKTISKAEMEQDLGSREDSQTSKPHKEDALQKESKQLDDIKKSTAVEMTQTNENESSGNGQGVGDISITSDTITSTKKEPKLVYCASCRWDPNVRQQSCEDKKTFKKNRYKLTEEEAIAEITKFHPHCLERAVQLVPDSGNPLKRLSNRGIEGEWVQDWEYANRTDYINHEEQERWGFPDDGYRKPLRSFGSSWRWEDYNSPVAEISKNGFCQVAFELNVTRLLVVGDSMSQNFHKAFVSLLRIAPKYYAGLFKRDGKLPCRQSDTPDYFKEVTIKYMRITKLEDVLSISDPSFEIEGKTVSDFSNFIETNENRTAVVLNIGAHMKDLEMYKTGFNAVLKWLDERNVKDPSQILAFYRDTVPGHPECLPIGTKEESKSKESFNKTLLETVPYSNYAEYRTTTDAMLEKVKLNESSVEWPWYWYQHANGTFETYNEYSKEIIARRSNDKIKVHWINFYNSTILRQDRHEGFGDCLHYRAPGPGDWWVHLFYSALLDVAGLREAND